MLELLLDHWKWVLAGGAGAVLAARKSGLAGPAAWLGKLKGLFGQASTGVKDLLNPNTDIGDVMDMLRALDKYADANGLDWSEDLKKMLNQAGAKEFDREVAQG